MIISRRSFGHAALVIAMLGGTVHSALADGNPAAAASFIRDTGKQLLGVVNGAGEIADKRAQLRGIIDGAVDVNEVARFSLGRFWRLATAEQQREYLGLFHDVLVANITARLGDYRGVTFQVGEARPRDDGVDVATILQKPGSPPTQLHWVVRTEGGSPKVVDVIAEGTSLRLTQRSDYSAFITRNGNSVATLLAAMKKQAES